MLQIFSLLWNKVSLRNNKCIIYAARIIHARHGNIMSIKTIFLVTPDEAKKEPFDYIWSEYNIIVCYLLSIVTGKNILRV